VSAWDPRALAPPVPRLPARAAPLSREDSLVIVRSIASADRLSEAAASTITAKADGNPFFLEELSWATLTAGDDAIGGTTPPSVTEVLRARIDRLPDATRQILSVAAVLGREVPTRVLAGVAPDPAALHAELGALKRLELLHDQPHAAEPTLVFKHALTQEAAYQRLSPPEQSRLHESVGILLEQLYAGRLPLVEDRLAYRFGRTKRADKAVAYLTQVGDRASRNHAMVEAGMSFRAARQHVEQLAEGSRRDRLRLDLVAREAICLMEIGDFPASITLITGAQDLFDRNEDLALRGSC
jgi:predicted ATPase